jgi:hypothetical protein
MKMLVRVGQRDGVTCWPEGTDAFGPSFDRGETVEVEYDNEVVTNPRNGMRFYIVAFYDKGKVRRFEVAAQNVTLEPLP